jgi:hypothetical protein
MRSMISICLVMLAGGCAVSPDTDAPPAPDPLRAIGLGGESLAQREALAPGAARSRIKPFSALAGEYVRVLGAEPAGLAAAAGSFGTEPARYFREPVIESGSLRTAHDLALAGCGELVARDTTFAAATEADGCTALATTLWSRDMSETEAAACVELAAALDPVERWTRVCASVMSAAGFLTY